MRNIKKTLSVLAVALVFGGGVAQRTNAAPLIVTPGSAAGYLYIPDSKINNESIVVNVQGGGDGGGGGGNNNNDIACTVEFNSNPYEILVPVDTTINYIMSGGGGGGRYRSSNSNPARGGGGGGSTAVIVNSVATIAAGGSGSSDGEVKQGSFEVKVGDLLNFAIGEGGLSDSTGGNGGGGYQGGEKGGPSRTNSRGELVDGSPGAGGSAPNITNLSRGRSGFGYAFFRGEPGPGRNNGGGKAGTPNESASVRLNNPATIFIGKAGYIILSYNSSSCWIK